MIELKGKIDRYNIWYEFTKVHKKVDSLEYAILKRKNKYYCFHVESKLKEMNYLAGEILCPYCLGKLMFVNSYKKGNTIVKAHLKHNVRKDNKSNCPLNSGNKLNNQDLQSIYNNIKYKELVFKNIIKDRINKNRLSIDVPVEYCKAENKEFIYKYKKLDIIGFSDDTHTNDFFCTVIGSDMKEYLCMTNNNYINIRNKKFNNWKGNKYNVIVIKDINLDEEKYLNYDTEIITEVIFNDVIYNAHNDLFKLNSLESSNIDKTEYDYKRILDKIFKLGYKREKTNYGYDWLDEDGFVLISYEVKIKKGKDKNSKKYIIPKIVIKKLKSRGYNINFTGKISYHSELAPIDNIYEIYEDDI